MIPLIDHLMKAITVQIGKIFELGTRRQNHCTRVAPIQEQSTERACTIVGATGRTHPNPQVQARRFKNEINNLISNPADK